MANREDYHSVIEAKKNEITKKGLDSLYGMPQEYYGIKDVAARFKFDDAYTFDTNDLDTLIFSLERTSDPKYVLLSKFLHQTREYTSSKVSREQALVMLRDEKNRHAVGETAKTLYREFKEIENSAKKINKKKARKLKKYKDVKSFLPKVPGIVSEMRRKGLLKGDLTPDKIVQLTEFFDSLPELDFLDKSKLTKNIR